MNQMVTAIEVYKSTRELRLLAGSRVVKTFKVAFGPAYLQGDKRRQGDNRTPEGRYTITGHNPGSHYHRSLRVSYPTPSEKRRAKSLGINPGGDIMVHGLGAKRAWAGENHVMVDWTQGCIAVTNEEIEEIYAMVPNGTPITIFNIGVRPA